MKKILLSGGMIVFVAALAITSTGAFFSDSETSTGNTFTAGAIDLTVDSEQHYNGNECVLEGEVYVWAGQSAYPVPGTPCEGTWTQTNLGITHKFFNFTDVKPGDVGENTISLHIDSNPAWVCADVNITANNDVTTVDPETDAGDALEDAGNLFDGELAQNIEFVAWVDMASTSGAVIGDNIWQAGEPLLFNPGPASNLLGATTTLALADSTTGNGPLPGGATNYIGLAWCAGDMTAVAGVITCDGGAMGNIAQTDSMVADLTFRVEQSRNNDNFVCSRTETPVVTTLTLAKTVTPAEVVPDSAFTLTASSTNTMSLISGIEGAGAVTNATVAPGVYVLTESEAGPGGEVLAWSCTGNATPEVGNVVTIALGESVTCEATNTYPAPAPQI